MSAHNHLGPFVKKANGFTGFIQDNPALSGAVFGGMGGAGLGSLYDGMDGAMKGGLAGAGLGGVAGLSAGQKMPEFLSPETEEALRQMMQQIGGNAEHQQRMRQYHGGDGV